tara:strand:+ start:114 stop:473 length:360 start_codon:yes stop_codon:yes gene_type:complete
MAEIQKMSADDWGLSLTNSAATRIRHLVATQDDAVGLRLAISGGGCSGFQYGFSLDSKTRPDDLVIERDGASMLIDGMSVALLKDSQIDWQEDIAGSMFVVKNPNATAMCGCGTSFSVG